MYLSHVSITLSSLIETKKEGEPHQSGLGSPPLLRYIIKLY